MTDTWGTFSHGTAVLRNYLNSLRAGGVNPHSKPEVVAEGDTWTVVDGHSGMGRLVAARRILRQHGSRHDRFG